MPKLNDPRREIAAQARAKGKTIVEAYAEGGYTGKGSAAVKFFQRPEIAKRVDEIIEHRYNGEHKAREIATKKAGLDESWIIERTKYVAEIAIRGTPILDEQGMPTGGFSGKPNLRAAVSALALLSDFKGMRIHRLELGAPGDFARMSDEELDNSLVEQARAIGLPEQAVTRLLELRANDPPAE